MAAIVDAFLYLFYGATIASLVFFVHKVLWLVHYKRIQRGLVAEAVRGLGEGRENEAVLAAWEEFAEGCWRNALGDANVRSPSTFVSRVEDGLARLRADMRSSRRSIEELLARSLAGAKDASGRATVLSLRRLTTRGMSERYEVAIDLAVPSVALPRPPDKRLYQLKVKSRYGILRRALVFFSGAADVMYSSHHVALMSQNVHVPTSVLVRRLSLVFLVLAVVLVDIALGARKWLAVTIDAWLRGPIPLHHAGAAAHSASAAHGDILTDNLGAILAFVLWLAVYGAIYLVLFFAIRRRYQVGVRRLRDMLAHQAEALAAIHHQHVGDLVRWGRDYGRSLDGAVEITMRHAETLVDHHGHRLRRRVASSSLIEGAKTIAESLFLRLPESRGDVQDVATAQRHTLRHHLWPRAEEMGYQVRFAQYRAAWQHLELAVNELRRERPDPVRTHELWRSAVTYATLFASIVPTGTAEGLREAYAQMVTECVTGTDHDLADLDRRLGALHRSLCDQLDCARTLVESKIELANQNVQSAVAGLSAEIINLREQARLEAMAFEI